MKPGPKPKDRSGDLPSTRICCTCKQTLLLQEFYKKQSRLDGYTVECKECIRKRMREVFKRNPGKWAASSRRYNRKIRKAVLNHYGPKCACCGESRLDFLAIEHIDGGGLRHRREVLGAQHKSLAVWLRANKYPPGFRLLCHNCNCARGWYGKCPHETEREPFTLA
jgi:hypothetical protein